MYYLIYIGIAVAAYYFYFRTVKLSEDMIVNSWSTLIDDAAGKRDKIFAAVRKNIEEQDPPRIALEEKKVSTGILSGLKKEEGEFTNRTMLIARNTRLKGFLAYVSVRDYGKRLQVSWYGTIEATGFMRFTSVVSSIHWVVTLFYLPFILIGKLIERFSRSVSPDNLNLFDQEELTAYSTVVHGAAKAAVEQVMKELDQDFAKVDTKTRGFLNIS